MTPIHLSPWQFFYPDFPHLVQLRKPSDSLGSAISPFAATIVNQTAPGLVLAVFQGSSCTLSSNLVSTQQTEFKPFYFVTENSL